MGCIKTKIISKKQEIEEFLIVLQSILCRDSFCIDDLYFNDKEKPDEDILYSTKYTLHDLEYTTEDVVERLRELRLNEYSETLFDLDNDNPPLLYVFGKIIKDRTVYIKIKTRNDKKVICISFHYAKNQMEYPYK